MAKYAISQEGADAMRRLSESLKESLNGLEQASIMLQKQIMEYMDNLGVLGVEIWNLTLQIKALLEDKAEIINELADKALQKSNDILELIGEVGQTGVISPESISDHTVISLGGVSPGKPMNFEEADSGNVNPNYGKNYGYATNCQSCVAVFEARLRGYDVHVLPNTKGSMLEKLSHQTNLVWIDPTTGVPPTYIYDDSLSTPEKYVDFIDKIVVPGNRYTIQFLWNESGGGGHIVNIDRNEYGELRIKDNQRGIGEQSEWLGTAGVLKYLSDVKFEYIGLLGEKRSCVPKLLRVDNMQFNLDVANQIMIGAFK